MDIEAPKTARPKRRRRRSRYPKPKPWPPRRLPRWRMPTGVKPLPGQTSLFPDLIPDVPGSDGSDDAAGASAHERRRQQLR